MRSKPTSIKIPVVLKKPLMQRAAELGYESFTGYIIGLIRHDLMTRFEHKITKPIDEMSWREQDKIDKGLALAYERGERLRSSWWEDMLKKAAEAASKDAQISEEQIVRQVLKQLGEKSEEKDPPEK